MTRPDIVNLLGNSIFNGDYRVQRAIDEIERLRTKLDEERNRRQDDLVSNAWMEEYTNRMRTAGDGLAEWVQDNGPGSTEDMTLLAQWNQARRP